ncbi:MAG: glutathione S-transferase [Novosphingobium lindaniclasticum]|jgi:glutathione S-transferase|uniref:glutathione S-transferase n=1 Tax=Novosphingobium lindaniclasticum TaxID=1329895 RepID=UPI00240A37A1|nr:glutathione S-transferase [Novosphingobium lindaniclasticum]MDF2639246.1 glutathione S-transferase [Novosphingobium lindaniclasticum]
MPADPILYSFRRCPYAMRARLALLVSGTTCELREVKLSGKPAEMLEASPKGTVPVLVLADGTVIDQSLDIMRWALKRNDPAGWLASDDAALTAANDGPFKHDLDRYKYPHRHGSDATAHRESGLTFLRMLEARLAENAHLCGPCTGLADAAIMPFVRQFAAVEPTWFEMQSLPRLQAWLHAYLNSDLFTAAMLRLPPWQPGDQPARFAELA